MTSSRQSTKRSSRRYTVNRALLLATVAVLVIAMPLAYVWHRVQLRKTAKAFLTRAEQLEKDRDWDRATSYYQRYLTIEPDDDVVFTKLVEAYALGDTSPNRAHRLNQLLYQAVGRTPDRDDLRRQLAENLLKTGQFEEAAKEAAALRDKSPDDAAAQRILALADFAIAVNTSTVNSEVVRKLVEAAAESPENPKLIEITANALREFPDLAPDGEQSPASRADEMMDQLVILVPENTDARIARYHYRTRNRLADPRDDLDAALSLNPDHVDALMLSAMALRPSDSSDQRRDAESKLRHAIEVAPKDHRLYLALAAVLEMDGRVGEIPDVLRLGLDETNQHFELGLALAAAQLMNGNLDQAAATVSNLESQKATYFVRRDTVERTQLENKLRVLQARLDIGHGRPAQAIPILNAIVAIGDSLSGGRRSAETVQASALLGQVYGASGHWDIASSHLRNVAELMPSDLDRVVPAVDALLRAGSIQDAVDLIVQSNRVTAPNPDLLVLQVQAHLAQQLKRSPDGRNWTEFEMALEQAKTAAPDRWELVIHEANYLMANGQDKRSVVGLLRSSEEPFANHAGFWRNLVRLYQAMGLTDDVGRALARHEGLAANPLEHARLQVAVLASRGNVDDANALLSELYPKLRPDDQAQAELLAVQLLAASNRGHDALAKAKGRLSPGSSNTELLKLGIDLALQHEEFATAEQWENRLEQVGGSTDDVRYLRARRQLLLWNELSSDQRDSLDRTVAEIRAERPRWFPGVVLAARNAQLRGDARKALADYQLAVELGDLRASTIEQVVQLLYELQRSNEAQQYLARLSPIQGGDFAVDSTSIELALRQDRPEQALELARKGIAEFPEDPARHMYLGDLLFRTGNPNEAITTLRSASEQFRTDPNVWLTLIGLLIRAGNASEAQQSIVDVLGNAELPASQRHVIAAQTLELMGDRTEAERHYELALEQQPLNTAIRMNLARLLAQSDPRAARDQLDTVLRQEPLHADARRELAILLAATHQDADWDRVSALLGSGENGDSAVGDSSDDRLGALLLARRGRTTAERIANCQAARKIIQRRIEIDKGRESDLNRLLLAQIYEMETQWNDDPSLVDAAHDELQKVVDRGAPNPEYLSRYIQFLLRHGVATDPTTNGTEDAARQARAQSYLATAETRVEELQQLKTGDDITLDLLITALKARLLQAKGDDDAAKAHVAEFASRTFSDDLPSDQAPQRYLAIGRLFTAIGAHAEAETWFRKLVDHSPEAYSLVVQSLVEQGRQSDAVEYCLQLSKGKLTPEMATLLANVITFAQSESEDLDKAKALVEAAAQDHGENVNLLQSQAVMRASRGEYDQAIAIFRRIVDKDPRNAIALNNLATLLGETPNQRAEALKYVDQAIEVAGRQPSMLDTKGTILLKLGDVVDAVTCLEDATASGAGDARYFLHLAAAYHQAQRREDARQALQQAESLGLDRFVLTDDDRRVLAALQRIHTPQ